MLHITTTATSTETHVPRAGFLFRAIKGKKWNLAPNAVKVLDPPQAKANAFMVPSNATGFMNFVYPVVYIPSGSLSVTITVTALPQFIAAFEVTYPGTSTWVPVSRAVPAGEGAWSLFLELPHGATVALIRTVT